MIPAAVLLACPHLAVPARLMYHVALVESDANPYAIGVVGGRLLRQPTSLEEAIATARSLETQGYNFSVGVAQVNHANLKKYDLDTYEKAFSICGNLLAGSRILAQCYADAGGVWGKAFSCYYSGDFTTGFRDGYVQRVLASLSRGGAAEYSVVQSGAAQIPVFSVAPATAKRVHGATVLPASAAYRVAIRTSLLNAAVGAVVAHVTSRVARADPLNATPAAMPMASASTLRVQDGAAMPGTPVAPAAIPAGPAAGVTAGAPVSAMAGNQQKTATAVAPPGPKVFVPQVADLKHSARQEGTSGWQVTSTAPVPSTPPEDSSDAAFVF